MRGKEICGSEVWTVELRRLCHISVAIRGYLVMTVVVTELHGSESVMWNWVKGQGLGVMRNANMDRGPGDASIFAMQW